MRRRNFKSRYRKIRGVRKFQVAIDLMRRGSEMSKRAAQLNSHLNLKFQARKTCRALNAALLRIAQAVNMRYENFKCKIKAASSMREC